MPNFVVAPRGIACSYSKRDCIGKGFFGSVYRGNADGVGEVAVKVQREDDDQPELQYYATLANNQCGEADMMMSVSSANVVSCIGYALGPTRVVLEMCDTNLEQHLMAKGGELVDDERFDLLWQLTSGLNAVHGLGIVHRDVKVNNIFVRLDAARPHGALFKIGDMGLARRAPVPKESFESFHMTPSAYTRYMSPEMTEVDYDQKVDMWALGMVLYTIVSKRGTDVNCTSDEVKRFVKKASGHLHTILVSLLEVTPSKRWSSEQLLQFLQQNGSSNYAFSNSNHTTPANGVATVKSSVPKDGDKNSISVIVGSFVSIALIWYFWWEIVMLSIFLVFIYLLYQYLHK